MRRLGLVLLVVLSAALALTAERLAGPAPAWRGTARVAASATVEEFLENGTEVVAGLARHFQEWEALVPEALERSLRVFGERVPALRRLLVVDAEGRVLAAFDTGARVGAERKLLGALDPAAARLKAMRGRPAAFRGAVVEAGTVERLELGAPILGSDGALRGYVAADLDLRPLCDRLSQLEAAGGLLIGLFDAEHRVVCPPSRNPPASGERVAAGAGMTLVLQAPLWRRALVPAGVLCLTALIGLLAVALTPRRESTGRRGDGE
ncbi:MAG TPA: PDC sensor domain-containing protein [Polyangia bacterium]